MCVDTTTNPTFFLATGEIRAEQRREKGVPQWTPDNEAERVIHKNPPDGKSKASKKGSNTDDRMLGEMMSAFCALNPTQ
jgi:hypothetical protein